MYYSVADSVGLAGSLEVAVVVPTATAEVALAEHHRIADVPDSVAGNGPDSSGNSEGVEEYSRAACL